MAVFAAFLLGVVLMGLALPTFQWFRSRLRRYRAAATLTENQVTTVSQMLHLTVQGSPTGVTVVDRTGTVLLSNARAHEMGVVHERTINEQVWEAARQSFQDEETHVLEMSTAHRRVGQRITSVRAVVKPLTLVDDRFVVVYSTDESESRRMESARRDFVANVSHELKTPVGGMALLAEAIVEASDDREQVEYFGNRINKEAHRLADMINELISLSKLQGAEALPDMEEVKLDEVVDEAINRNKLAADNAGIELLRGRRGGGVSVLGDRSLLITAVSNLISNAINYSPTSMPVSVSTKVVNDELVLIRVIDRGIGIAPEHQDRVFERFFRVDKARSRSTGGTGLGLAIVKHVAANHGGDIKLWSRLGTGSTFTIELPIYNRSNTTTEPERPTLEPDLTLRAVGARRKDK
ncbi:ATP-binding protein [Corynebacterium sp. 153RC1]|uniref:sensor histidine kinase n=1 Tax=Corynebacterium TaxID=1716 RepID=UPI00211CD3AA|nr:ATP-binding protein [Corynebacterium sp. 76QC2CO]MCQ9351764.1 ATP-binding protein [Corynebacterium sp. 209RC1]MCQ9354500.1 ATP-binding protein [Corynebacterium sp. 1222RC1]MCQ9356046.1 ATP-binding protein [Corynebacterium sp. 122RC1]MCQ9358678.1 ATP-binding protein [Corynebacterium sp. 142RC1]MCQ9360660.1 ATP-binding protein [Corynebacterium sp. 153RC1]MCQ9363184.1 ATP-binding protein [Corynebacterium sp. 732RC1]MCQ9364487.1 ATP-binding protein [Corynebacterium sp. 70RC1]